MTEKIMKVFDGYLLYDEKNLKETIEYCQPRNRILLHKSLVEIKKLFLETISEDVKKADKDTNFIGTQQTVFNAFYYIDKHVGTELQVDGQKYASGRFELNLFVRLGREVINV